MGSQRGHGQVTDSQKQRATDSFRERGKGSGGGTGGGPSGKPMPLEPKPPIPKPPTGPRPPAPPLPPPPGKCTLSGTVNGQDRAPLAGAKVELRMASMMVVTNEKGYYKFVGLTPGQETLAASFSGFKPYEERIEIGDGQNTRNIVLKSLKEV